MIGNNIHAGAIIGGNGMSVPGTGPLSMQTRTRISVHVQANKTRPRGFHHRSVVGAAGHDAGR
jgi:hypothetical protein